MMNLKRLLWWHWLLLYLNPTIHIRWKVTNTFKGVVYVWCFVSFEIEIIYILFMEQHHLSSIQTSLQSVSFWFCHSWKDLKQLKVFKARSSYLMTTYQPTNQETNYIIFYFIIRERSCMGSPERAFNGVAHDPITSNNQKTVSEMMWLN